MVHISFHRVRRAGAAALATTTLLAPTLLFVAPAFAADALTGTITVSSPSNAAVAAATPKQVVLLTVSGAGVPPLSEENVDSVTLGTCTNLSEYIVLNATTIVLKTPASTGCAKSAAAEDIVIKFVNGDTLTEAGGITFVTAPGIGDASTVNPMITDNSVGLSIPVQVNNFSSAGGQVVRVLSAMDFGFDPRPSAGLSVVFGGKAGTDIKVYDGPDSTTVIPATTSSAPADGNALTFRTASGMSTSNPTLTITQNGISKTFNGAVTGASITTPPSISSLSVTTGRSNLATQLVIRGANFNTLASDYSATGAAQVKFCGVSASVFGNPAVNAEGTEITVSTPTPVTSMLGSGRYAGPCEVVVTGATPDPSNTSAVTPATFFMFLKE